MRLAADRDLGALGERVGDMLLDLGQRLGVDQRPKRRALGEAVADLQPTDRGGKLFGEGRVDESCT